MKLLYCNYIQYTELVLCNHSIIKLFSDLPGCMCIYVFVFINVYRLPKDTHERKNPKNFKN